MRTKDDHAERPALAYKDEDFIDGDGGRPIRILAEYLAPLPEHFKRWRHEECATAIWVGKVVPANWKVTMEAFMEAWHTVVTHPQLLPFTGDENSAYWTWGDNVNVNLVPSDAAFGTASGPPQPSFSFNQEAFWVQTLNFGVVVHY